jgi:uncharacterized protein (TIGR02391 family)
MRHRLVEFDELAQKYQAGQAGGRNLLTELRRAEPTLIKILNCLDPNLALLLNIEMQGGITRARSAIQRGVGICDDMDEWATRLAPESPSLPADQLHPWVWEAARTFWETNHYRAAVHAAASSINAHLQNKLGRRDVSDVKLVQEALSEKAPEPGKARLRIPGDPTDLSVQTRQRGALQLGVGAYSAFRNPAAHESGDLAEQEALEQLATFSVFARLVAQCQVIA